MFLRIFAGKCAFWAVFSFGQANVGIRHLQSHLSMTLALANCLIAREALESESDAESKG